jgi:hypothetical protein
VNHRFVLNDRVLLALSAAAFLVICSAAAVSSIAWYGLAVVSVTPAILAGYQRASHGLGAIRTAAVAALIAAIICLTMIAVVSIYALSEGGIAFGVHFRDRDVPWWLGASLAVALMGATLALCAVLGHVINRAAAFARNRGVR